MSATAFRQGNLVIADGRLHVGRESLPLVNIESATERRIARPKRHWNAIMITAVVLFLGGIRFSGDGWGWALIGSGVLIAAWGWFFHREPVWTLRLNLLLNQRIQVLFTDRADLEQFLAALSAAKGGRLPVARAA